MAYNLFHNFVTSQPVSNLDMAMDEPMKMKPVMSEMQMSLKATHNVGTVLFKGNKISTPGQFFALLVLILIAGYITQLLMLLKEHLKSQQRSQLQAAYGLNLRSSNQLGNIANSTHSG